ncbi:MAG: hypothetical protein HKP61_14305 [Dactylosporangium sp.]|nr:hypothetical protein [Dactylosporangium sp.]NNJ62083.1 hypothetical protein [Dactylosporangium sp.]
MSATECHLDVPRGPASTILRDIDAAVATGRLQVEVPKPALAVALGSVLATLRLALADPDFAAQPADEHLADALGRATGAANA